MLLLAAGVFLGRQNKEQIRLSDDTSHVEQEVWRVVPKASAIKDAKITMERNGFTCSWKKNQEFATFSSRRQMTHSKADFLYCHREQGFPVEESWQIAIVHRNGLVTDVGVSYGLTGP